MLTFLFLIMLCSGGLLYCAALVIVLASALSAITFVTFRLGAHHDVPIQVFIILRYANIYIYHPIYVLTLL